MNTAVPPGNCVTHGYHGLAACPRCSSSTLPAAPISAGQAHAAVSPFDPRLTVEHVERLERRIKEQRDHITRLVGMREPGDRYTRKRMAALERALGRVSLGAEKLKEDFAAYRVRTDVQRDAAVREAEMLRERVEALAATWEAHKHDACEGMCVITRLEAARELRAALASSRDTTETT